MFPVGKKRNDTVIKMRLDLKKNFLQKEKDFASPSHYPAGNKKVKKAKWGYLKHGL